MEHCSYCSLSPKDITSEFKDFVYILRIFLAWRMILLKVNGKSETFKEHYQQMQLNYYNKWLLVDKMFWVNTAWFLHLGFTNYL